MSNNELNFDKIMHAIHHIFDPSLPRLAPGSDASTRRALDQLFNGGLGCLAGDFQVVDMGCGNGAQTLCLARELGCPVTAVDNHQPYLDELMRRARAQGVNDLVRPLCADMNTVDLAPASFDLVWAEGSAFVMGVAEALQAWRQLLKPGAALGFTDLFWLKDGAPAPCRDFFAGVYPAMPRAADAPAIIDQAGFDLVGRFTQPADCWWESFYQPLQEWLPGLVMPDDSPESRAVLDMVHGEIANYQQFSDWFGYVFFLLRARA